MRAAARLILVLTVLVFLSALAAAEDAAVTVAITAPEEGLTIASSTVEVSATYAAPAERPIVEVALVVDGTDVEVREVEPPTAEGVASFIWAASSHVAGEHRVEVRATDSEGTAFSAEISVLLHRSPEALGPGIRISSPAAGETVSGAARVEVAADQPGPIKYVIFLVDNVFKAMTNIPPFAYVWDTTRYLNGLHTLQVKAYLKTGGESFSPAVEVRVDNPSGMTTLREPEPVVAEGPAPEPQRYPVRAGATPIPPPMRTESPASGRLSIYASEPAVAAPGTAPFVTASGDLIMPPAPGEAEDGPRVSPVEIAMVPTMGEPGPTLEGAGGAEVVAPAAPEPRAVASATEPPAPVASPEEAAASEMREPRPAPVEIALLPTAEPAAAPEPTPAETVAAAVEMPPVVAVEGEATATAPEPVGTQIAMLPPRPMEALPTPKVAAAPVAEAGSYVVQPGDCLWAIAAAHNVSPAALARLNELADANLIHPGQRLRVPSHEMYCDGEPLRPDVPTVVENGRAIVSLRSVVESLGGTVVWEPATREASANACGHQVAVAIGSAEAHVDGTKVNMGAPAALRSDRTVVPLRFLGNALDLGLEYENGSIRIASAR